MAQLYTPQPEANVKPEDFSPNVVNSGTGR
jgi:hypothetical protein